MDHQTLLTEEEEKEAKAEVASVCLSQGRLWKATKSLDSFFPHYTEEAEDDRTSIMTVGPVTPRPFSLGKGDDKVAYSQGRSRWKLGDGRGVLSMGIHGRLGGEKDRCECSCLKRIDHDA